MTEPRKIDWHSAEVHDGQLLVRITGEAPTGWSARVKTVLRLLAPAHTSWAKVRVTREAITVDGIEPGAEPDVHHFLESVILEANSAFGADPFADPHDAAEDDPGAEADLEMTEAFRAFAAVRSG